MKGRTRRTLAGLAAGILLALSVGSSHANTISVVSISDKDVGGAYPFTSGSPNPEATPLITVGVNQPAQTAEFRSALEFDISAIPLNATINAATLFLTVSARTGAFTNGEVHGYAGDGIVLLPDFLVSNLVTNFSMPAGSGAFTLTINATSFLQSLVNVGPGFAGFVLRGNSNPFVIEPRESTTAAFRPRLDVDFTPTALPEPASLSLLGAGVLGLLRYGLSKRGSPSA